MKKGTIIGIVLIIIFGVLALVTVLGASMFRVQNQAVSIIGGADGPTAVFVAGSSGGSILVPAIFAGIVLVIIIVAVILIVKKNRED